MLNTATDRPLERAPLDLQLGLDLAFAHLSAKGLGDGAVLVWTDRPELAQELALRAGGTLHGVTESAVTIGGLAAVLRAEEPRGESTTNAEAGRTDREYQGAIWCGPRASAWGEGLRRLSSVLGGGAGLAIISGSGLAGVLGPLRRGSGRCRLPWATCNLAGDLTAQGFEPVRTWALGSAGAVPWAVLARIALHLGRRDLADRAESAYRRRLVARQRPFLASARLDLAVRRRAMP